MKPEWDVVVIGAGLGGLAAAACLVKEGRRTLVLDRNSHAGGTASVYHRRGFAFPMGPLGFSHPRRVEAMLAQVGVADAPAFRRVHYRIRAFGLDAPISLPARETRTALSGLFPAEASGLTRFFDDVAGLTVPDATADAANVHQSSAADYVGGLTEDARLRRILGSLGTQAPTMSRPLLLADVASDDGTGHLASRGRPGGLLRPAGTRRRGGRARGLWTSAPPSPRLAAGSVSAPKSPASSCAGVPRPESSSKTGRRSPRGRWSRTATSRPLSCVSWMKMRFRSPGGTPYPGPGRRIPWSKSGWGSMPPGPISPPSGRATRIIHRAEGGREAGDALDPESFARREMEVSLWSGDERAYAPAHKAVVVIRVDADYRSFAPYRKGRRLRAEGYAELKKKLASALIREAEVLVPGLGRAVEAMDVATPLTFKDQGGRSEGAVAGWSWSHRDKAPASVVELVRTPVRGLYMAGYQAYSALFLGGVPTALASGLRAARAVLAGEGPDEEVRIPEGGPAGEG